MATRISTTLGNVTADEEIDNIYRAIAALSKKISALTVTTPTATTTAVDPMPSLPGTDGLPGMQGPPGEDGTDGGETFFLIQGGGGSGGTGASGAAGATGAAGMPREDGQDGECWSVYSAIPKPSITMVFCDAFTPAGTGADVGELVVPKVNGQPVLWNVLSIFFRVGTAGGAPAMTIEKYTGTSSFSATTVGTVTLGSGANEGENTSSFTTAQLTSRDKVRFNVGTLATATAWTIQMELTAS